MSLLSSRLLRWLLVPALFGLHAPVPAQAPTGTTAFCPFEVPDDGSGRRRWINLAIVQYVDAAPNELRVVYGGGNLGSGHELRIDVARLEDALALLERIKEAADKCR